MKTQYQSDSIVKPKNFPKIAPKQFFQKNTKTLNNISSVTVGFEKNNQKPQQSTNSPTQLYQIQSPSEMKQNPHQNGQYYSIQSSKIFNQKPIQQLTVQNNQYVSLPQQTQLIQYATEQSMRIQTQPSKILGKKEQSIQIDQNSPQKLNLTTTNNDLNQNSKYSNDKMNLTNQLIGNLQYSPVKLKTILQQNQQVYQMALNSKQSMIQYIQPSNQISSSYKVINNDQILKQNEVETPSKVQQQCIIQFKYFNNEFQNRNQQEQDVKINMMDQKMNILVGEINSLQVLVVKKNKEAKYWKQKFETIDQNMASFLSDDERIISSNKKQKSANQDSIVEEERDIDNSEEYQKRDSLISKLKFKIKDVEQQLFDKDIYYKEQLDSITKIIMQKDDYLQSYAQLNQELLDKIEIHSLQSSQFQQVKEDNEQLFQDLQQKQEKIERLQKQLNIDEKTSLYNSQSKNNENDNDNQFKDTLIDKLNCEISILNAENSILQSQLRSLLDENQHLLSRVKSILCSQNRNMLIQQHQSSNNAAQKGNQIRDSEIQKIQQQINHYSSFVKELQNDLSYKDNQNIFKSESAIPKEIQSTQRDSSRQQSQLGSDYAGVTDRRLDANDLNYKTSFIYSKNSSPIKIYHI